MLPPKLWPNVTARLLEQQDSCFCMNFSTCCVTACSWTFSRLPYLSMECSAVRHSNPSNSKMTHSRSHRGRSRENIKHRITFACRYLVLQIDCAWASHQCINFKTFALECGLKCMILNIQRGWHNNFAWGTVTWSNTLHRQLSGMGEWTPLRSAVGKRGGK
jgi:hypothetical protein